jgi:ribonuclease Z
MVKITFLGTADSIPSKSRNHLSVLLTYEGENILFDCGEGTQRQFRKAGLNPCKVGKILISHWHGDHVLGLPGLLSTLALSGYNKELEIYGPKGIKNKIDSMLNLFKFKRDYKIVVKEVSSGTFFENKDFFLEAEKMEHGIACLGYNFVKKGQIRIDKSKLKKNKIKEGIHLRDLKEEKDIKYEGKKFRVKDLTYKDKDLKISFVVDTKDNERISKFVKDADIFISEATYDSSMKKEAEEHKHMTVDQVAKIAKKAKVKKLYLAHVSSRYLKNMKEILDESKKIFDKSYLVRDLDSIEL